MKYQDFTGMRFGKLTVLRRTDDKIDRSGRKYITWLCKCDCGNYTSVTSNNLRGKTTSCGCYLKSVAGKQTLKHGLRKTRLYRIYNGRKQRCNNPNRPEYKNYGGRGIKVCDEWNIPDGLPVFAKWAKENGYRDDLTIERKDVNKGYSPDNCCWIPLKEQSKNTTRSVYVVFGGEKMILADFSRKIGVSHESIRRMLDSGLSPEEIAGKVGVIL